MTTSLKDLQPADKSACMPYIPYYQGQKRDLLPFGISLYRKSSFEGERRIEGGESIPFLITWNVSTIPTDLTRCRVRFSGDEELTYEVTLTSFEFIDFLIELLLSYKRSHVVDFSQAFYKRLLGVVDQPAPKS